MSQKRLKQSRSIKKGSPFKDNKKGQKNQMILNKVSPQELQNLQTQMVQQFLMRELKKTSRKIDISLIDEEMAQNIMMGQIKVSERQQIIQSLIRSPQEQALMKITPQQMEMYEKQAKRIEHIKLINNLNKQLVNKEPEQQIPYILSKDQHQKKVRQIVGEKRIRQRRAEEAKQALKQKLQIQQQEAEKRAEAQRAQEKQRKRIEIEQKITRQKEQHIHLLSSGIKHRKDLQDLFQKVPLHIKMQDDFKKSVEMPELEQRKQQLKQLRQFRKRYSVECIKEHQKQYDDSSKHRLEQSKMRRLSSLSRLTQQNAAKMPEMPERLKVMLAQQAQIMKRQWKQKQIYAEEKIKRQENYMKKLKEEHKPKIDKEKQQEILRRLIKEKEHLSKVGLQIDRRKVGLEYLGEVKKQVKKRKQLMDSETAGSLTLRDELKSEASMTELKRSRTQRSVLSDYRNSEFFEKIREQEITKILNSKEQPEQKLQKLKIESQKLQEAKHRKLGALKHNFNQMVSKQASSLALNSLKAKINLIDLMKKKSSIQRQSQY